MAPAKNKKRNQVPSKSTTKKGATQKKPLRKQKETATKAESTLQKVDSDKKTIDEDKKVVDAKESVPAPAVKKPCTWLRLDRLNPQAGSKPSVQTSKEVKETKPTTDKTQAETDNKRKRKEETEERGEKDLKVSEIQPESHPGKKGKGVYKDRHEEQDKRDEEAGKKLGGLIFMCNAKTKADCFNYQLMGISANKKDFVMSIKPGLKLFLYDYDLKLLYGIFEASSTGGMKLEPTAFGGAFPAQVRFAVVKECLPLPESMFKKAIKDSYDEKRRKFKMELTVKQVKNLNDMFRPTPWLQPHGRSLVPEGNPISGPIQTSNQYIDHRGFPNAAPPRSPQDPLFLTEQEYRNNGLRQVWPPLPAITLGSEVTPPVEPSILDLELKQLLRNPVSTGIDSAVAHTHNSNFPSEREYRMYGLRAPQQIPNPAPPVNVCDPYDESTTSLVNRYLGMSSAAPVDPYPLPGRVPDGERAFASYSLGEQPEFNRRVYLRNSQEPPCPQPSRQVSAPVSQRYSFSGPSR